MRKDSELTHYALCITYQHGRASFPLSDTAVHSPEVITKVARFRAWTKEYCQVGRATFAGCWVLGIGCWVLGVSSLSLTPNTRRSLAPGLPALLVAQLEHYFRGVSTSP